MAGCKRCALKRGKREREKEEKRKDKRRKKCGSKSFFFYKSTRMFFHMRSGHFFKYIRKTVSRLSRSYPLLFAIKILMVSQFWRLARAKYAPHPYFGNFFKYLWPSKDKDGNNIVFTSQEPYQFG